MDYPKRIFDIPRYQLTKFKDYDCLYHFENEQWQSIKLSELVLEIDLLSSGLLDLNIKQNSAIGIASIANSYYWHIIDMACQQIGLVVIPLQHNYHTEELKAIIDETNLQLVFTDSDELAKKISPFLSSDKIFGFYEDQSIPSFKSLKSSQVSNKLDIIRNIIKEDDLATIIYTSGSTSKPKGVMLSHRNIISNVLSIVPLNPLNHQSRCISFLPLAHVFERTCSYAYMVVGASIYCCSDPKILIKSIKQLNINFVALVPRILERVYNAILLKLESQSFIRQKLFNWAIDIGKKYKERNSLFHSIQLFLARILVYRSWHKIVGRNLKHIVVGGAALNPDLSRLFSAGGIKIRQGYGLSETSPVVTMNRFEPGGYKFGTVGMPIPGVEVKIKEPNESGIGEILVRGPNVMIGYYKNEKLTKESKDSNNWFHTGDLGVMIEQKFLKITGRNKSIYKTSSGKYVSPSQIEGVMIQSLFIEHAVAIGFQKPFVGALIVPNFDRLKKWATDNKVHWTSPKYMVHNPEIIGFYEGIINALNLKLKSFEQIRSFELIADQWSIESGQYSPTYKLKRSVILDQYDKNIKLLYKKEI